MAFFNEHEWLKSVRARIAASDKRTAEDLHAIAEADPTFDERRPFCFIWTHAETLAHEAGREVGAEAWRLLSDTDAATVQTR